MPLLSLESLELPEYLKAVSFILLMLEMGLLQ